VLAVIDAVGRPVHLVGASYGGTLALHTAATEPSLLRSLAVFEPPLFAAGEAVAPLLDRYRAAFPPGRLAGPITLRDHDRPRSGGRDSRHVFHSSLM
jgi:pimeloyl-ACP methyl ester carboxylesterase